MYSDEIAESARSSSRAASDKMFQVLQNKRSKDIDEAVKYAQLSEMGYQVTPGKQGMFGGGGMTLTRDPSYVSKGELERKKLQAEVDRMSQPAFGGGGIPANVRIKEYDQFGQPKSYEPADYMSPLESAKLEKIQLEKQADEERQRLAEDNLRESTQGMLNTVGEVKKGKEFFGPLGNLPTIAAPSSLVGKYGERKNWEVNVEKLLSQKIVDLMAEMKNVSKTGATGFGQLNEKELMVLQNASTALKRDLNPADAERYLNDIERLYQKVLNNRAGSQPMFGQGASQGAAVNPNDFSSMSDEELKRIAGL